MPIFQLIKKYDSCPLEWEEGMLFACSQHNTKMYRPLNKTISNIYVSYDFIINNPENWQLHENKITQQNDVDIFIIPKQYKKEFLNIIEIGLKNSSDTKEIPRGLYKASSRNFSAS